MLPWIVETALYSTVGEPNTDLLEQVKAAGFEIVTVLPEGGWRTDLASYTEIVDLPALGVEGGAR